MQMEKNNIKTNYLQSLCVHQLFESQVKCTPDAIAVVCKNQQLTYQALNVRANQLAHYLKTLGVKPEILVGLCVERSLEMVIGILAILKAGGAYVPLEPMNPKKRLAFMLSDAQVPVLLTKETLLDKLSEYQAINICLDTDWEIISQESQKNPINQATSDSLAYVIYTSGSTGKPKGVMIPHRAVYNHTIWMQRQFPLTEVDKVLQKTPFTFDASVWEFFTPLSVGAQLFMAKPGGHQDSAYLVNIIVAQKITILQTVPTLLRMLLEEENIETCHSIKHLFCGGEILPIEVKEQVVAKLDVKLINLYGPTEACIDTTFFLCQPNKSQKKVPIGQPIDNTQVYILDPNLQPVSDDITGEVYISGTGLARGYLNRPELTAGKFIPNPFSNEPNSRLYKTGDLARYLSNGYIEFLGRIDHQVKIRGFRIEIGEIETALIQYPDIQEVVVVALEIAPDDKRVVAYFIDKKGNIKNTHVLSHFLKEKLPDYMIPATFVRLEKMPLTSNGKVDRKALPMPIWESSDLVDALPTTPTEIELSQLWGNVLGVSQFSIHDNFFELGGHSLLATRLISRARETFQADIPISVLFDNPTVATLATQIDSLTQPFSRKKSKYSQPVLGEFSLSTNQQSFWLFEQLHPNTPTFNIPFAYKLTGTLNLSALEQAFTEMVSRHTALRTHFEITKTGTPLQRIISPTPFSIKVITLNEQSETAIQQTLNEEIRCPFDLAQEHLWRVTILPLRKQEHILLLTFHHLITDGWSIGVFIEELMVLYAAFLEGTMLSIAECLPKQSLGTRNNYQYIDFCQWQQNWLQSEQYQSQLAYWQSQLHGPIPVLELPTDYPRPPIQTYQGARQPVIISPILTAKLHQLSHQQNVTLFMTLLAAFKTLLYRYTGQTELTVGTAVAGRQQVEWENVIGLFINNLVLRTTLSGQMPFLSLLSQVRKIALAAYNHQDLPFQNLVDSLHLERDLSHNPLFQTFFLLQNFESSSLNLSGLTTTPLNISTGTVKFDLTLELYEKYGNITGWFEYNTALFSVKTIQRMVGYFQNLLANIVATPETKISILRLLTEAERNSIYRSDAHIRPTNPFTEFTKTDIEQSIPERFAQQVKRYPHHIAVKTKYETLTYLVLNQKANQVAHLLLKHCGENPQNIALLFEHDVSMIVGLFGVLKAGLTYVPLAPDLPIKRLFYILQDSQAIILLTNDKNLGLAQKLKSDVISIINIDEPYPNIQHEKICLFRKSVVLPDSLAYILYTSGSTGQPKGVIQNHRNVLHFIRNYTNNLHINADDKLTLLPAYSFDAAVMDIFGALLNGATLYPINIKEDSLTHSVKEFIKKQKVTIYHSTPTVYRHIVSTLIESDHFPQLRLIVLGGEEVYKTDVDLYKQHFYDNCIFINGLGPTESTVSLQYFMNHQTVNTQSTVPVGYPVEDTEIVLLNKKGEETELYGEIALTSAYVALGYWQKPEITKAAFSSKGKQRCYRTGDMGRLREDGSLEFVGRKDAQIKLRGYRIELGEIETVLEQHDAVQKSLAILWGNSFHLKQIVAYIIPVFRQEKLTEILRDFLKDKLPDYMIPSGFVMLDTMPLLPNGKVDRCCLPIPKINRTRNFASRNSLEHQLTNIWKKVLDIPSIGIHDNFFDLGGHSLLAIKLLSKLEKNFGRHLPLITLFQAPTIAQQAILLKKKVTPKGSMLEIIQAQGNLPPFFFIGSTNYARVLAPELGDNQPVYGLNIFGLQPDNDELPSLDVKKIAKQYCQEILTIQPEGPYYLSGYCGDAKVAFEIAQQFQSKGQKIAFLAFIDVVWQPKNRYFGIYRHWHNLLEKGPSYLFYKIRQKINYLKLRLKLSWGKRISKFYQQKKLSHQLRDMQFINSYYTALNNYEPQPYQGHIILFLSSDWRWKDITTLNKLAIGGLNVYEVTGYHDNLFDVPQVNHLGKQIKYCLERK
ncbi:amino acid adenylation domain-containing protein [Candidatus Parabeggiatoa sp. HSG14]|uniref:amino acid adenylation domain-containing protein n=1 Tax=Candidatus Parabeggiatoa sp. HSG14 TaxID=3055593 RepID=UPI0025A8F59B|nr:amino acid adenylation domain-containing protein [Thiotrichales bacterium HSG14]